MISGKGGEVTAQIFSVNGRLTLSLLSKGFDMEIIAVCAVVEHNHALSIQAENGKALGFIIG